MSNYFVALDVGASKIVCLRGSKSTNKIIIDSVIRHPSEGIKRGEVINEKIFIEDLSSTIYEAEKKFSENVAEVFINISSLSIKHKQIKVSKKFQGRQVTEKDLQEILQRVKNKFEESGNKVIKICFLYHYVEGIGRILEPEYMFVKELTSTISVVYGPESYIKNLEILVAKSHTKVKSFTLSAEAAAACCLSKEDLQHNTVFLDMGASTTDYVIYENGIEVGHGLVPLGGNDITKDIAIYFNLNMQVSEEIKRLHGGLISEIKEQYIKTQDKSGNNKVIDKKLLREIIFARLEEIIKLLIKNIGVQRQAFNFILTGGVSNTSGIETFLTKRCGIANRVVTPGETGEFILKKDNMGVLSDPSLSTACGLLKIALKQKRQTIEIYQKNTLFMLFKWIKENF